MVAVAGSLVSEKTGFLVKYYGSSFVDFLDGFPPILIQQSSSSAIIQCSPVSYNNYMHTQLRINTNRNYDLLSVMIGLVPPGTYYHTKGIPKASTRNPACTDYLDPVPATLLVLKHSPQFDLLEISDCERK